MVRNLAPAAHLTACSVYMASLQVLDESAPTLTRSSRSSGETSSECMGSRVRAAEQGRPRSGGEP